MRNLKVFFGIPNIIGAIDKTHVILANTPKKDPTSDWMPVSPGNKRRRPKTMQMILEDGEVYPPPIMTPLTDRATDHAANKATGRPKLKQEDHAQKPGAEYFLPLALVFIVGIGMAVLVHQVLRGPGNDRIAKSTSLDDAPLDDRPYEFVGPIYEERKPNDGIVKVEATKLSNTLINPPSSEYKPPVLSVSKPPDLLSPTLSTPLPEPIFVLGKNISDPTFPSFLQTSLDRIIASTTIPVQFSRSLRELDQVPTSMTSAKLLAFRAECLLEGENKNVSLAVIPGIYKGKIRYKSTRKGNGRTRTSDPCHRSQ